MATEKDPLPSQGKAQALWDQFFAETEAWAAQNLPAGHTIDYSLDSIYIYPASPASD